MFCDPQRNIGVSSDVCFLPLRREINSEHEESNSFKSPHSVLPPIFASSINNNNNNNNNNRAYLFGCRATRKLLCYQFSCTRHLISHTSLIYALWCHLSGRGGVRCCLHVDFNYNKITRVKCNFPPFLFIPLFINLLHQQRKQGDFNFMRDRSVQCL